MRAFGDSANGIGLTQREFSRSLYAGPVLHNPSVQRYGSTGESITSYIITGSYTVAITDIPSPIRVTESAPDSTGARTYTIEPLYGLQLINPFGSNDPLGSARWYFVPGDTVGPAASNSDPPWSIGECRNSLTCHWQPPGPGRIQVSAYVETRRARARSNSESSGPPPALAVSCRPDSLVVGNTTTCTASVSPETPSFTVQSWQFTGDSLGVSLGQTGDTKSWTFAPTVCGTVTVTGRVDGATQVATARVEVLCNFLQGLTGDSILDSPRVQKELRRLWQDSNPGSPSQRLERGSVISLKDGEYHIRSYQGPSTRCTSAAGAIQIPAGELLVAFVHTHPDPPDSISPCDGNTDPSVTIKDGASSRDQNTARGLRRLTGRRVAGYIIERDHVHRFASDLPTRSFNRNPNCP